MKAIILTITLAAAVVLSGCANTGRQAGGFEQSISDAIGKAMEVDAVTVTITFKPAEGDQSQSDKVE